MRWRIVVVSFAAAAVVAAATAGIAFAKQSNDNIKHAEKVKSFPFEVRGLDTTPMTLEDGEVISGCVFAFNRTLSQTVWYRLEVHAEDAGFYSFNTAGSTYDTVMTLYQRDPGKKLPLKRADQLVCDDDNFFSRTLQAGFYAGLSEGTYYLQIGDYDVPSFAQPHTLDLRIELLD
jgi:hypothetical protein